MKVATASIEIKVSQLSDTSEATREILAELPEFLEGYSITVNCAGAEVVTRAYTDQLCLELLENRKADELVLSRPPEAMTDAALRSSYLRGMRGLRVISR